MRISHNAHEALTSALLASIQHEQSKVVASERKRYSAVNKLLDDASMELKSGDVFDDLILKKIMEVQQLVQSQIIILDDERRERI